MKPAVFLDKDGTLVENVPYNVDVARVRLAPFALPALARLQALGFALVVATNQSGVALGYYDLADVTRMAAALCVILEREGIDLSGYYFCPHSATGSVREFAVPCTCRKPKPGMLLQAARELDLDLANSWMLGDILDDVEAGHRAGCRSILIDNGGETEWLLDSPLRHPDYIASDLLFAARYIASEVTGYAKRERELSWTK
jgi:histidinol-phosphate phosphatase family protein